MSHHGVMSKAAFIFEIAWRNLWRYPVRSLLTIAALAGGLTIVIFYAALVSGSVNQMVTQATQAATGYLQVHAKKFSEDGDIYSRLPLSMLDDLRNALPDVNFSPRLYAYGLASSDAFSTGVHIRAIDPVAEEKVTILGSQNISASFALPLRNSSYANAVIVGKKLAKQLQLSIGSELILVTQAADGSIGNDIFIVQGISKPIDPSFDRLGVLMRLQDFRRLMVMPEGIHEIAVGLTTPETASQPDVLARHKSQITEVVEHLQSGATNPISTVVRSWRELNPAISDMLELQSAVIGYVGLAVMFMASFGVMNTLFMSVFERKYEFGVMRSVGMKGRHIFLMVLCETAILTLVAAVAGNSVGYFLSDAFKDPGIDLSSFMPDGYDWAGMSIEPFLKTQFEWGAVQQANGIMIVVVVLATVYPLLKTIRKKPVELLS